MRVLLLQRKLQEDFVRSKEEIGLLLGKDPVLRKVFL